MARTNKSKARMGSNKAETRANQNYISMQQEARNTEGRDLWRIGVELRHRAVHFVSAGSLEPAQEISSKSNARGTLRLDATSTMEGVYESASENATESGVDPGGSGKGRTPAMQVLPARPRSPKSEYSSEDEIVFRGRRTNLASAPCAGHQETVSDSDLEGYLNGEPAPYKQGVRDTRGDASIASSNFTRKLSLDFIRVNDFSPSSSPEPSDGDDILADYIANIDDSSEYEEDSSSFHEAPGKDKGYNAKATEANTDDLTSDSESDKLQRGSDEKSSGLQMANQSGSASSGRSRASRKETTFASTSAFADAVDFESDYGFDYMDFGRASLKKRKNKGHDHFNLDALDFELETGLLTAWNKNRLRKKSKKKEREELRAQGLLGRRKDDPDLGAKYAGGISLEDLKAEIRQFILSSKTSLSLPPMTKHRRVLVHDMAHVLCLTSKSRGKGSSRFPVLSKTSRTPKYTLRTISQLDRVLSKGTFSHRAVGAWDNTGVRSGKSKSRHSNVSYVDGDVVGASAPEIGAENIGRAMLEKMGWSRGTALGAIHNKGILLPVSHVVKNSKAGLG